MLKVNNAKEDFRLGGQRGIGVLCEARRAGRVNVGGVNTCKCTSGILT